MRIRRWFVSACVLSVLAGCGDKPAPITAPAVAVAEPAKSPFQSTPDFGGVKTVTRESDGIGSTVELATLAALQSAVAQVNGVKLASSLQTMRAGLSVTRNDGAPQSVQAESFLARAISASAGSVLGYRVLLQQEVKELDSETVKRVRANDSGHSFSASASASSSASASARAGDASANANSEGEDEVSMEGERGASSFELDEHYKQMRSYWKVKLAVDIAQYRAPDEQGRPKIVVAQPRMLSSTYAVGEGQVPAVDVARAIRSRLSEILTQTKRFIVLDREFGDEMQAEIDKINSGSVRAIDTARIGQQLATDLILIPTIENFAYPKSTRSLHMSSRELVSYQGGGRINLKLVNATTGEVVMSESFEHALPPTAPSTLARVVNGEALANEMMDTLSGQMGSSVVAEIFPISVVALAGNRVVLSQGGDALHVGERFDAVSLGEELTDPQTGRSLGRMEMPCCVVRIERVERQTSYGVIDDSASVPAKAGFVSGSIKLTHRLAAEPTVVAAVPAAPRPKPAKRSKADAAPEPEKDPDW